MMDARETAQIGEVTKALVKYTPLEASLSRFGVFSSGMI
jgi:hypothetical protein